MNILITSIGQRGYILEHFRESAHGGFGIFAADATKYAPAFRNADKAFVIPLAKDPKYYSTLLKICKQNGINGIVSINDLELPVLARHREEFANNGIIAVISESRVIDVCFDKYLTYCFCKNNGIATPSTYLWNQSEEMLNEFRTGRMTFPLISKPRKGSRSIGVHLVNNMRELLSEIDSLATRDIPEDEKNIFQEYINSEQYSVHVFNDASLNPVSVVGMVNIFKHLGETYHIRTYRDPSLTNLGIRIGKRLRHYGPLSADVHKRDNGEYVVLEFNPRLSGCYSLTHFAGADFTGKILSLIKNDTIQCSQIDAFEDNVIMLKQFTTYKTSEDEISILVQELEQL